MAVCGTGFGFFQSPNNRLLIGSAPPDRAGAGSGMVSTSRLIGQTTGSALVAVVFGLTHNSAHPVVLGMHVAIGVAACFAALGTALSWRGWRIGSGGRVCIGSDLNARHKRQSRKSAIFSLRRAAMDHRVKPGEDGVVVVGDACRAGCLLWHAVNGIFTTRCSNSNADGNNPVGVQPGGRDDSASHPLASDHGDRDLQSQDHHKAEVRVGPAHSWAGLPWGPFFSRVTVTACMCIRARVQGNPANRSPSRLKNPSASNSLHHQRVVADRPSGPSDRSRFGRG